LFRSLVCSFPLHNARVSLSLRPSSQLSTQLVALFFQLADARIHNGQRPSISFGTQPCIVHDSIDVTLRITHNRLFDNSGMFLRSLSPLGLVRNWVSNLLA
jgi:hypothetical protein